MKITKKLLTLALAALMLLSLAAPALAADSDFVIENGVLVKYIGSGGNVVIPSGVTKIGESAFIYCISLTSVTIPDSVTSIGEYAFAYCNSLTDVYYGGNEAQWEWIKIDNRNEDDIRDPMVDATIHYNSTGPDASTTPGQPTAPAVPNVQLSSQPLTVDGKAVSAQAYNIGGSNFFKLRDVAMMLGGTSAQFSVGYDAVTRAVTAASGEAYTAAGGELTAGEDKSASCVVSDQPFYVDGVKLDVTVYNIGGSNYFMLRDLGEALGFGVDYDNATRTVLVTTK